MFSVAFASTVFRVPKTLPRQIQEPGYAHGVLAASIRGGKQTLQRDVGCLCDWVSLDEDNEGLGSGHRQRSSAAVQAGFHHLQSDATLLLLESDVFRVQLQTVHAPV